MTKNQYIQMVNRKNRKADEVADALANGWRPATVAAEPTWVDFTAPQQTTPKPNEVRGFAAGLLVSAASFASLLGGVVLSWFL